MVGVGFGYMPLLLIGIGVVGLAIAFPPIIFIYLIILGFTLKS